MTWYGTSYFKSVKTAVKYYSSYIADPEKYVDRMLAEGSIHIGKPSLQLGEKAILIDDNTRYAIVEDGMAPKEAAK